MSIADQLRSKLPGGSPAGEPEGDGRPKATWISPNRMRSKTRPRTATEALRRREQKIREDADFAAKLGIPYVPPGS